MTENIPQQPNEETSAESERGDGSRENPYDLQQGLEYGARLAAMDDTSGENRYFIHNKALIGVNGKDKTVSPGKPEDAKDEYVMRMVKMTAQTLGFVIKLN